MKISRMTAWIVFLALSLSGCNSPAWVSFALPINEPKDKWILGHQIDINSIVRNDPLVTYRRRVIWNPSETTLTGYDGCDRINKKLTAIVGKATVNCDKRTMISSGDDEEVLECDHSTYIFTVKGIKPKQYESPSIPDIADAGDIFKYCSRFQTIKAYALYIINK